MVVERGDATGNISGGCLEQDVREVALQVMQSGWPEVRACPEIAQHAEALLRLLGEPRSRAAYLKAVRHWAGWRSRHPGVVPPVLHVNLSPRQLHQQEFLGFVHHVLGRYGVEPSNVCVELTETVLMDDLERRRSPLTELRDLGLRIALDDFGTGYSSLTYLKRFPVDCIKIDQSFVAGVADEGFDAAIVESVIDLAHAVGLSVVAEGVETPEQLARLRELGCDQAQGYLFSKARPARDLDALLAQRRRLLDQDRELIAAYTAFHGGQSQSPPN